MNFTKRIIGIVGTQGAGKDTAARFFESHGFVHFSLSDIVRDETEKLGLEHNRDNWRNTADALRAEHGNDVIAKKMVQKLAEVDDENIVITSFRHPGEVDILRNAYSDLELIGIDAPIEMRYERITGRGKKADKVTFEEFKTQEEKENVTEGVGMRLREVMERVDILIQNDGLEDDFYSELNSIIESHG